MSSKDVRSIASQQNQCLVISSAGSGKTTSIVGKVLYLTKIKHIDAKNTSNFFHKKSS